MSEHSAIVIWHRGEENFDNRSYSRAHTWRFDGGTEVLASASPSVVIPPLSNPAGVDPEEAFVAALSSCHMLWFLYLAAEKKWPVESYEDQAVGRLGKNAEKKTAVTRVVLRPLVSFSAGAAEPSEEEIRALHQESHERCFIANSVTSEIVIEPRK